MHGEAAASPSLAVEAYALMRNGSRGKLVIGQVV
jgi:hypothetical protein